MARVMDDMCRARRNIGLPLDSAPRSGVVGVILAAGCARRFDGNKLLASFKGRPLLRWVIDAALHSRLASLIVVLGHEHARVRRALSDLAGERRLSIVVNQSYRQGQSTSVMAGLAAVPPICTGAMFLVGDQPLIDASVIDRLIAAFEASEGGICFPSCQGQRGNPVVFSTRFFPKLLQLKRDRGGSAIIEANRGAAVPVCFSDPTPFRDVDSRTDLDSLSLGGNVLDRSQAALTLVAALGLETSRVISLCGAGGKTSLMAALTREFSSMPRERVLATTSTKMAISEGVGPWRPCETRNAADILAAASGDTRPILAYRALDYGRGRLLGVSPETIDQLAESGRFTRILVEADGSRCRPLKAPNAREPVFPSSTDTVVIVASLSGLGRPLEENTIFRAEHWSALTGVPISATVTADALARVIEHPSGLARGAPRRARRVLFLNQADTPDRMVAGHHVLEGLPKQPLLEKAVIGRLRPELQICAVRAFWTDES